MTPDVMARGSEGLSWDRNHPYPKMAVLTCNAACVAQKAHAHLRGHALHCTRQLPQQTALPRYKHSPQRLQVPQLAPCAPSAGQSPSKRHHGHATIRTQGLMRHDVWSAAHLRCWVGGRLLASAPSQQVLPSLTCTPWPPARTTPLPPFKQVSAGQLQATHEVRLVGQQNFHIYCYLH